MKIFKKKIAFIGWDCNKMIKKRNNNNRHTNAYMHIKKYSLCCFIWMPSAVGRIDMYVWLLNNISWKATAVICAAASKQMPNRFHFLFCGNRTVQCSAYCAAYICVNRQKEMLMITNTKIIWFLLNLQIQWIKTKQHKTTYFHVVEWRMGAFLCGKFLLFFFSLQTVYVWLRLHELQIYHNFLRNRLAFFPGGWNFFRRCHCTTLHFGLCCRIKVLLNRSFLSNVFSTLMRIRHISLIEFTLIDCHEFWLAID